MPPTPPSWLPKLRGRFIVFDGPDGSGKTTQYSRFLRLAQDAGIPVCEVREPGGTGIGEQIRSILLDPANDGMDLRCEMLLYMASRAQLVAQRIGPALRDRHLVLADRFISSTVAYQGRAGGLEHQDILQVGKVALHGFWPDLVVILDVDEKTASKRLSPLLDRIEKRGAHYHRKVRQGFLQQAQEDQDRHLVIDACPDPESVFSQLMKDLGEKLDPA